MATLSSWALHMKTWSPSKTRWKPSWGKRKKRWNQHPNPRSLPPKNPKLRRSRVVALVRRMSETKSFLGVPLLHVCIHLHVLFKTTRMPIPDFMFLKQVLSAKWWQSYLGERSWTGSVLGFFGNTNLVCLNMHHKLMMWQIVISLPTFAIVLAHSAVHDGLLWLTSCIWIYWIISPARVYFLSIVYTCNQCWRYGVLSSKLVTMWNLLFKVITRCFSQSLSLSSLGIGVVFITVGQKKVYHSADRFRFPKGSSNKEAMWEDGKLNFIFETHILIPHCLHHTSQTSPIIRGSGAHGKTFPFWVLHVEIGSVIFESQRSWN